MSAAKRAGTAVAAAPAPSTPPARPTPAASAASAAASVPGSPHGLPPKPAAPQGVGASAGPGASAELSATPISAAPAPAPTPAAPAPPVEAAPKVKLTDAQLESFLESREILVWRGLRAAAQEGYLHQFNKPKTTDPPHILGDLETLQAKIQQAQEAEAAAVAAAKLTASPTASTTSSSATVTSGGTVTAGAGVGASTGAAPGGVTVMLHTAPADPLQGKAEVKTEEGMDVDENAAPSASEDTKPAGVIPLSFGANAAETIQAALGLASETAADVEMGESKPEVKDESL